MAAITLLALNLYPVKSAARFSLSRVRVDARGLAGDRRWMVVDESRGFLKQQINPRLALVSVAADGDRLMLATLATYRRIGNQVMFGQNLVREGVGELAVGDGMTVLDPA